VPAILEAWRAAERQINELEVGSVEARQLAQRIKVLKAAHAIATEPDAAPDLVIRFLEDHGIGEVAPPVIAPRSETGPQAGLG
jgi:hypothetical protein